VHLGKSYAAYFICYMPVILRERSDRRTFYRLFHQRHPLRHHLPTRFELVDIHARSEV
jgi:hypothetical protein